MNLILAVFLSIALFVPSNDNNIRAESILSNNIQVVRVTTQSQSPHFVRVDVTRDPNYEVAWASDDCSSSMYIICIASIDKDHPAVFVIRFKELREGTKRNTIKVEDCWTHYIIEQTSTNSNRIYTPIARR